MPTGTATWFPSSCTDVPSWWTTVHVISMDGHAPSQQSSISGLCIYANFWHMARSNWRHATVRNDIMHKCEKIFAFVAWYYYETLAGYHKYRQINKFWGLGQLKMHRNTSLDTHQHSPPQPQPAQTHHPIPTLLSLSLSSSRSQTHTHTRIQIHKQQPSETSNTCWSKAGDKKKKRAACSLLEKKPLLLSSPQLPLITDTQRKYKGSGSGWRQAWRSQTGDMLCSTTKLDGWVPQPKMQGDTKVYNWPPR